MRQRETPVLVPVIGAGADLTAAQSSCTPLRVR